MNKQILFNCIKTAALFLMLCFSVTIYGQTTVFSDDFATSAGTTYTTSSVAIGSSSKWNQTLSGSDFGANINSGILTLTNDASGASNNNGWNMGYANTSGFTSPYTSTLASNPGMVTWTFNMRQPQANPSGFANGDYGVAFILAGTTGTTLTTGTGYAVTLGNSGKTDPIKLVSYSSGLATTSTIIQSNTSGLTDFGNPYISVKVTYTPSTNNWQLYVRNDGVSFIDPNTGSLTSQGTATNSTYTSSTLGVMGGLWNASTKSNQAANFDNVKVTVVVPTITSIAPSSAIAGTSGFTLTVNGTGFVSGTSVVRWNGSSRTTTFVSATQLTAAITATDILTSGTAAVTVANGVAVSNAQTFTIDPAGQPTLTLSTTGLSGQSTTTGTASSALTYTISGANLTTDPIVTAPTNFEISKDGTTYATSITLARTGNTITGQPLTLYSRLKASAPAGIYSGSITHTATGATTKNITVSGTVLSAKPTTQATAVVFSSVTSTSFTATWTNGNGSNRLVLISSSAINASPVSGTSYYSNVSFGNGSVVGSGNYVVYNGISNSVTVTDLQPATTYYIAVYEFNGSGGTENYLATTPATGNKATINSPVGWQIYAQNAVNTITFDSSVDGVNSGQFQAGGMEPVAAFGDVSSNAFAITGFSDGAIAFGGTSVVNTDYERGTSSTSNSVGGLYAFQTSSNNYALGIQPATGDFVPGSVTLRLQNQTGAAVTSINIGYKVYVYNDQAASSSFNFSYSTDNSTYTSVSGLNVTSPTTADVNPGWKAYYRVMTITGLNVASNNYYYLRWTGATVSGTGAFDAFGLDDIVMVVNPSSTFVPFSGAAEDFVIQGNTTLSGDTVVTNDVTFNGGKVDINGNTLTLNGTVTNTTTQGIKSNGTSNLIIGGAVSPTLSIDQTTLGTTNAFNNLSVNTTAGNTVTVSNPIVVNGALATTLNQSLNLGTNALTGTLATISNNGNILTQNTTATPFPSGKTWGGTGILNLNGATQQTLVTGTYNNLTITTAGGAVASASLTVNGILNLPTANPSATVGSLSMGTYTLTMGGSATNIGIGDVSGIVTRNSIISFVRYTFGNQYTAVTFPTDGTLPTSMSVKIDLGVAPSWQAGMINRTYDFIQTGGSGTKAVIKAHYLDSELNGNVESKLVEWLHTNASNTITELGRANYDSTDNWVELTSVNVGLYFASTFGAASLTLDESAATNLTWNGSVNDSWSTAANWTPNGTTDAATYVIIPDAATTPNDPIIDSSVSIGKLEIQAGGILNAPANSQFTVNGAVGAWINNGTYNPGTGSSNVIFTNLDTTMGGSTNFNNLTVNSGAGLRPMTGNYMNIMGTFTNNGKLYFGSMKNTVEYSGTNQVVAVPNITLLSYAVLIINGTGAVFPTTLNIKYNLTLNQPVNFSGKTIIMSGAEAQFIDGLSSPTFDNLTINNSLGGVSLSNNTSVTGTLTLTSGLLNVGTKTLTLGATAVSGSFDATKMIVVSPTGQVRRAYTGTGSYTFPVGENTESVDYSPITVNVTAGTFSSAYVGVTVVDAIHPNNYSPANNISRYWNVAESGITNAVATISATYTSGDILGTEASIAAAELTGTFNQQTNPWIKFTALGSNTATATGAVLTAGQTAAFTGIKGGVFSAAISGYGSFCQNENVTLTATPTNGDAPYTYSWSNGLGSQSMANPSTSTVGSTNYTVTVKDTNGITATDTVTVVVLAPTVGGTIASNQSVCAGSPPANLILSGNTGSVLYWQSAADGSFTNPINISNTTSTLTGATIGVISSTTYFRAVVQNGSCSQMYSATVAITVTAAPTTATNTSTQTLCSSGTASLSGNSPIVGTGTWSVVSGPSTSSSQFSNVNNPAAVFTSAGGSGDYVVRWTISNAPCSSSYADATITISGAGASPTATNTSTQTICATSTATLSANTPTVGIGAWSILSGPSTATSQFSSLSNPTAVFTPSGGVGTYQIRWTVTNLSCTASADATITVIATPTTATNTSTQTICGTLTATLAANTPTVGTGVWTVVSGPSTASGQFSNTANPTAVFTPASGAGDYIVRWTISNPPCSSSTADATVTVVATPTTATNMSNQTICIATTATLAANTPTVGTGVWTVVSGPSTASNQFSNTANPTAVFTPASGAGEYIVRWTISNSPCSSSSADATITVNTNNTAGAASSSPTLCINTALTNITHTTTGATGIGTSTGLPTGVTAAFASNTITISGTPTASGTFNYSIPLTGGCGSVSATGTITVDSVSVGGTVSTNQTICSGSAPTDLTLSSYTGSIVKWQSSIDASFTSPTDLVETSATLAGSTIGSLTANTYFRAVVQSGVCSSTNSSYILVTVDATTVGGTVSSDQTICSGSQPVNLTLIGYTGSIIRWESSLDSAFTSPIDIIITSDTLTGATIGSLTQDTYFRALVQSGVCSIANSSYILVTVNPTSVGGDVTGGTAICSGTTSGLLTLSGYTGTIVRWESSVFPFTSWTTISNTNDTYTSGVLTQTTEFRGVLQSSPCVEVYSTSTTATITTTTWTGGLSGSWDNGIPDDGTKSAVISSSYTSAGNNIDACSLTVNSGATVVISSGDTVTLSDALTAISGSFVTFNNNANLIQTSNVVNSGAIIIKRNSSFLKRLDYTLWSSPVANQQLKAFSPATLDNRFYTYNTETIITPATAANIYVAVPSPSTTNFATAKGYLIRTPNNHSSTGAIWTGSFSGVPNNGSYNFTMVNGIPNERFNLVGNPYPSPIDAVAFVNNSTNAANTTGTLYFWRKTNNSTNPSYSSWNEGVGYLNPNGEAQESNSFLNKIINIGQGFFVEGSGSGTSLVFDNSMRIDNHDNQFFRLLNTTTIERNRIWLKAFNSSGLKTQTLLGYVTNATLSVDKGIDGKDINNGDLTLSTLIGTVPYAIQGRPVPFDATDIVPLNFKVTTAGDYTIAIDHVDGLFTGGAQSIYLKDNLTATIHNLNTGAYTFVSDVGTFNSRFEIVYTLPLGIGNPIFTANNVIIYHQDNEFVVNTGNIIMSSIRVFDIRGRLLQEKKEINTSQTTIGAGLVNEVLLVQITSTDGIIVTKKVIR